VTWSYTEAGYQIGDVSMLQYILLRSWRRRG